MDKKVSAFALFIIIVAMYRVRNFETLLGPERIRKMFRMFENENIAVWTMCVGLSTLLVYFLVIICMRVYYLKFDKSKDTKSSDEIAQSLVYEPEYFFNSVMEVMISNTCILGACFLYSSISNSFPSLGEFVPFILLVLILAAIFCNNLIDKFWLNKRWISGGRYSKENLRLISSVSILVIVVAISIFFHTDEYYKLALCVANLVLGRFIYFDSSVRGFKEEIDGIFGCWPCFLVAVLLLVVLIVFGIKFNVLEYDNAIKTLFYAHIFYLLATEVSLKVWTDVLP